MFSRRVVTHSPETFEHGFEQMIRELHDSKYAGDQMIAINMEMNIDFRAYHAYSFQTVAESDSGRLIEEFLELKIPKLFLYGEANRKLSYLPRLKSTANGVEVTEIPKSAHFFFYDNPAATYAAIGEFIRRGISNGIPWKALPDRILAVRKPMNPKGGRPNCRQDTEGAGK